MFPHGKRERYLSLLGASGLEAEIYIQPGKEATQGRFYTGEPRRAALVGPTHFTRTQPAQPPRRRPPPTHPPTSAGEGGAHAGRVCAVLGAGNQGFLTITDVLTLAFVDGCVVLVKYHDIQAPAAQYIDHLFEPLRRWGAFESMTCGLPATRHLLYSPLVDCVHMTGGSATHDAIVWGAPGEEQERRKAANDPLLKVTCLSRPSLPARLPACLPARAWWGPAGGAWDARAGPWGSGTCVCCHRCVARTASLPGTPARREQYRLAGWLAARGAGAHH